MLTDDQLRDVARRWAARVFPIGTTATLDLDQITAAVTAWAAAVAAHEDGFRDALTDEFRALTDRASRLRLLAMLLDTLAAAAEAAG